MMDVRFDFFKNHQLLGGNIMKKLLKYLISLIIILVIAFLYYYATLPAINIHSPGLWFFILGLLIIASAVIGLIAYSKDNSNRNVKTLLKNKLFALITGFTLIIILIYVAGSILSSPIVNAKKYQTLLTITDRNFTDDIKQISFKDIPILDKNSAELLGSRKMGSIIEYVSQFEVAPNYTQINYQGTPVRVTPLMYGSVFKWLSNHSKGIPAYIQIDMTTQEVQLVKLDNRIGDILIQNIFLRIYTVIYAFIIQPISLIALILRLMMLVFLIGFVQ